MAKYDEYFKVRRNVIYERARFNHRSQQPGETSEQFIMYELADNCDYGDLRDEMIRDCIVVGIRDTNLSERLQLDSGLTLAKAKQAVRQREAVHEQNLSLSTSASSSSIDVLQPCRNQSLHRCFSIWPWSRSPAKSRRWMETCRLCIKGPHRR